MTRPRIIAFAYDAHPDRGSEPGAGWAMIQIVAGFADLTVLTRSTPPDPDGSYRSWQARIEPGTVTFEWVPLPGDPVREVADPRLPWWSRQHYLAYLVWQAKAVRRARGLQDRQGFDLAWHLTWANGWVGSTLSGLGVPFVLGPIGGGVGPPWRLAIGLGPRPLLFEALRSLTRTVNRLANPLAHRSWRRARLILVQNRETQAWLPAAARRRARIFHNATVTDAPQRTRQRRAGAPPVALFVARLVGWKGCALAVETVAGLPDWRLVVCGAGQDQAMIEDLIARLEVKDRVELRGWQPRDEILRLMAQDVDVLLFPSLHDEAGLAVAEAAAIGLPIVCLDRGGPPLIAGHGVPPDDHRTTIRGLRDGLVDALDTRPERAALDPDARRQVLLAMLREAALVGPDGSAAPSDGGVRPG